MQKRRHEIDIHKDMLRAQIKSSEEERQTVRYSSGGRTGEGTWQPVSFWGWGGGGIRVLFGCLRKGVFEWRKTNGSEPFSLVNSWMPKFIQRVFVMGFDMQMCHSLTLSWQRSALRLRSELAAQYENDIVRCCRRAPELCMHSRILVREPCLILQKFHFRLSWVPQKHLCLSSLFTRYLLSLWEKTWGT